MIAYCDMFSQVKQEIFKLSINIYECLILKYQL